MTTQQLNKMSTYKEMAEAGEDDTGDLPPAEPTRPPRPKRPPPPLPQHSPPVTTTTTTTTSATTTSTHAAGSDDDDPESASTPVADSDGADMVPKGQPAPSALGIVDLLAKEDGSGSAHGHGPTDGDDSGVERTPEIDLELTEVRNDNCLAFLRFACPPVWDQWWFHTIGMMREGLF